VQHLEVAMPARDRTAALAIRTAARPLAGGPQDFDALLELIGNARVVLLGEASHGTHDFYRVRAEITKRLIREKGFAAVAIEGDWPDAFRVDQFVRAEGADAEASDALAGFERFPQWMWRNADVLDFVGWLRGHNETHADAPPVRFAGLDLYSLHRSIEAVLEYLDIVDPNQARIARRRYDCFAQFGDDARAYGYATAIGTRPSCEDDAVRQLLELQRSATEYASRDGRVAADALFSAEQNARLVRNAERYYRLMLTSDATSWNLRDGHMAETLIELERHLEREGRAPKVIVWAHNSHLGDARATQMARAGEWNVGQLVRQRLGDAAVLVGFTTYTGTVTAASDWDGAAQRMTVRPALPESYEALFHNAGPPRFMLDLRTPSPVRAALEEPRLERAIGVIYRPQTERFSHYFGASLPSQFDVVLHYDVTRAVEPLERTAAWETGEVPETYPFTV
jgi:erythromycin esterase-like protein